MIKQWIKDNTGLLFLLVLMAVSAVYVGKLILSDSFVDHTAVMKSSSRAYTPTGDNVVIQRGAPAWYIYLCTHLSLVLVYSWLFIAGVRDRFTGPCVAFMILALIIQIASIVFLGNIVTMLDR